MQNVVFMGSRGLAGTAVMMRRGDRTEPLPLHLEVYNHSPSGFEWGYLGSGPAQLALALCVEVVGVERALRVYQQVKENLITTIAEPDWVLTGALVLQAVVDAEQQAV
ncbi:MAG TPA: DUF6166 domain-containing protein [Mycobacterium sp.]|nr:DUF6166 domain-containing protein [Mycobacterium sp.]